MKEEQEELKVIGLQVDGLRKLKAINMKFAENGITQILGDNEQGKTTLAIDTFQILIRGNKFANKDIVTKGKSKATLIGQIGAYKISRIIPKDGTATLKVVDTRTGQPLTGRVQDFLDTLINELTFNPRPFLDRNKNEKLKFMMELCKLDFSKIDAEIATLYDKRKLTGQEVDRYGEIIVPKKVARVNTSDIIAKKKAIADENENIKREYEESRNFDLVEIEKFNKEQRAKQTTLDDELDLLEQHKDARLDTLSTIKRLEQELAIAKKNLIVRDNQIKEQEIKIKKLPAPLPEKPLVSTVPEPKYKTVDELDKQLEKAAETNQLANEYESQVAKQKEKESKQAEYKEYDNKINSLRKQKLEILAGTNTGVEGLTITEDDILYKGISSDNWSDAQGLIISSELCISQMPKLKAVFMDRAESIGKKKLAEYEKWAVKNGIQVILTRVADEAPKDKNDYTFFIVDGSIVEEDEE